VKKVETLQLLVVHRMINMRKNMKLERIQQTTEVDMLKWKQLVEDNSMMKVSKMKMRKMKRMITKTMMQKEI